MTRDGDSFRVDLSLPAGVAVDYCFLITKRRNGFTITWPLCDGNYRTVPLKSGSIEVESKVSLALVSQEIRYVIPQAKHVYLVWGLNGWHVAPEELRPVGTELRASGPDGAAKAMHVPMFRDGDTFVAKLWMPVGTTIDYGFLVTELRGLFDINYPVWDGDYKTHVLQDSVSETRSRVSLIHDVRDVLKRKRYFVAGIVALIAAWLSIYGLLWITEKRRARVKA
jgi:hypothetical protein